MRYLAPLLFILLLVSCGPAPGPNGDGAATGTADSGDLRPAGWAEPLANINGLPNLHRVDDGLYRGAQPEEGGYAALRELGVRTVVNLREHHENEEEARAAGLDYVRIPIKTRKASEEHVAEFLAVAADPERRPVFVHCMHGSDRTGLMAASYRVAVQGWTREDAVTEMKDGGFGFHRIWRNLPDLVEEMDIEKVRREAGIDAPGGTRD